MAISPSLIGHELAPADSSGVTNDDSFIDVWVRRRRSLETQRAYRRDITHFRSFVCKPLGLVTVGDLIEYRDRGLDGYSANSRRRMMAAVKSALAFGQKIGYLRFNVGPGCDSPASEDKLAERILTEMQVHQMIANEPDIRNIALILLTYASGARVSEVCRLRWRDTLERGNDGGQITLFGKGGKTRHVLLSRDTWKMLTRLKKDSGPEDPVFLSGKGGCLTSRQVRRVVEIAGDRVGIDGVSPHWLRHAHVSHALDRGCPPHVVQATVGHSSLQVTTRYIHVKPTDSSARYLGV